MEKFTKIGQYRNALKAMITNAQYSGKDSEGKAIYTPYAVLPKVLFRGTVKVHGTNAGIRRCAKTGEFSYQSRERVLSREDDNYGFCNFMMKIEEENHSITFLFNQIREWFDYDITIYGEWAGEGVQRGVGVSNIEKTFFIFAIKVTKPDSEEGTWLDMEKYSHVYCAYSIFNLHYEKIFPVYQVLIDLNEPHKATQELIDITKEVERECPVAIAFGEQGVGEGVVWQPQNTSEGYRTEYMFKVKGEKHSDSKVKKLVTVDPEVLKGVEEFVEATCTEHRLEKGISFMKENGYDIEDKTTGVFVKWIMRDILTEESDTLEVSGLNKKMIPKALGKKASKWYIERLNR